MFLLSKSLIVKISDLIQFIGWVGPFYVNFDNVLDGIITKL